MFTHIFLLLYILYYNLRFPILQFKITNNNLSKKSPQKQKKIQKCKKIYIYIYIIIFFFNFYNNYIF